MVSRQSRDDRREAVAEAVLAVVARSGLVGASLREVARELGCTTGVLSHHFRDKRELLQFALQVAGQRSRARMERCTAGLSGLARVRETLAAMLPLDDERSATCAIFADFASLALTDPALAGQYRDMHRQWSANVIDLLQSAVNAGELMPSVSLDSISEMLSAFVVGVGRQALMDREQFTPERQLTLLDDTLHLLSSHSSSRRPLAAAHAG